MHETRRSILLALRGNEYVSFGALLREVAETSDNLTYHLKQMQRDQLVESPEKGVYRLAYKGLLYITTNQEKYDDIYPTVSCLLRLTLPDGRYIIMKKQKLPSIGLYHDPTFALHSHTTIDEQILEFAHKYKIELDGPATYAGTLRYRKKQGADIVFDKLFLVHTIRATTFTPQVEDRLFFARTDQEIEDNELDMSIGFYSVGDILGRHIPLVEVIDASEEVSTEE